MTAPLPDDVPCHPDRLPYESPRLQPLPEFHTVTGVSVPIGDLDALDIDGF
jgi:hypothetical protein